MREPEFTQAKWGFMYVGEGRIYITFDGQEFLGEREIDYDSVDVLADEIKADARLINASPKMYALLRNFVVYGVLDRKEAISVIRSVDIPDESDESAETDEGCEYDSLAFLKY